MKKVSVLKPVLVSNKERAAGNRRFFDRMNSLVINIISSPGSGKTSFIKNIIGHFKDRHRILVIEGDIKGQVDAEYLRRSKIDVVQINTLTECHLDAFMTAQVLIENVGNLVCPAEFEIGEDFKLAILSTPEGDDKPLKYPLLFHLARVVVINKTDLLPYVTFDMARAEKNIKKENPRSLIFQVSAQTGKGFEAFNGFLEKELIAKKKKTKG
jgi:hydrogenase nickel incorporation protein HypB